MDSKRNWILVDAASSITNAPVRVGGRRFLPTYSGFDNEARISSINRLNERIQRRITSGYTQPIPSDEGTARKGARLVDESFRFISEEDKQGARSPSERLDSLIAQTDSRGEVEAVFERRRRPCINITALTSNRNEYHRVEAPTRIETRMWPASAEPVYAPSVIYHDPTPSASRVHRTSEDVFVSRYQRRRRRRADSVDSGSFRLQRRRLIPRVTNARSIDYLPDPTREYPHEFYRRPPLTLRRPQMFYDKCDLCANKIFRFGDFCPACGRTATVARPSSYWSSSQLLLSPQELSRDPWQMYRPPNPLLYTRNFIQPQSRRAIYPSKEPVFRYGTSLPEALYDYEVWARQKDGRRQRRKIAALVLALLALALVISAGVVLAAVKT